MDDFRRHPLWVNHVGSDMHRTCLVSVQKQKFKLKTTVHKNRQLFFERRKQARRPAHKF
jgi:hypothetical protein